jgi:MtrB/PioB family decaheme-associated outer membrane protein
MKTNMNRFPVRLSVAAVHSAILAMAMVSAAQAQDATVADLTQPRSTVEIGAMYVNPTNSENRNNVVPNSNGSNTSYKFGEYNGLQKQGTTAILNFDLRGGGSYDSEDATRYRITGTNLGLETRNLSADFGKQGSFRINLGYDELLRNRSDSYQTPYLGEGGNNFVLPSNWIKPIVPQTAGTATTNTSTSTNLRGLDPTAGTASGLANGIVVPPTAATLNTLTGIRAADLADFHNVNLYTKRSATSAGATVEIDNHWSLKASIKRENKTGYKPLSVVTSQVSEYATTLADPISQTTDQYNVSLNYRDAKSFFSAEYYGSVFTNDIKSVTWNDISDPTKTATIASAPSNQFHQLNLTGGYTISPVTKFVWNASTARNTQDEAFVTAGQNNQFPLGLPGTSLQGVVVTTAFNAKLTSKATQDLGLMASYKYENRDNQTPVNTYYFQDANEAKSGVNSWLAGQGSNLNMYANRAYSKKLSQLDLGADYKVNKDNTLKFDYDAQQIDRSCNGSWINCADAPTTKENTLSAQWRTRVNDDLNAKLGYARSQRTVNYDENAFLALVPYANVVPTLGAGVGATQSLYSFLTANGLTGFGPWAGLPTTALTGNAAIYTPNNNIAPQALYGSRNNINELIGMRRFNMADRNRDKLRTSLDWQASEAFSLQASYDFDRDNYQNSIFGLQGSQGRTLNLEGNYDASENLSTSVFYSNEDRVSTSAGDAYGANAPLTATNIFVGNAGNVNISPAVCYATIAGKVRDAKVDPCLQWSNQMHDKVDTLGWTLKQKGLLGGKLDLSTTLVWTRARTDIDVTGGSYVANPYAAITAVAQPGGIANYYIAASAFPTVTTDTAELRITGRYALDKKSSIRLSYGYAQTKAVDWSYDGYQFGTGTNYMPTNEQAPNYVVQTLGVAYTFSF